MKKEKLIDTGGLEPATAAWVKSVLKGWELEEHHVRLLLLAAQHWDRTQAARRIIEKSEAVFLDRFSQPKPRPEIQIERDSSICFSRLIRELALDVEPPKELPKSAGFVGKGKK